MSSHVRSSEVERLADLLLDDVERIAERSVVRMQGLLPSYARVSAAQLIPLALTSTRNLLEAVRDPDADPIRSDGHFRVLGETRLSQGAAADEMLQGWRILLEVVREEAHPAAGRLGVGDDVLLDLVEATLRWGDRGMSRSAAAYREAEIGELERLAAEKDALRRVAVMVATGSRPDEVFDRVAMEVGLLLRLEGASIDRYESDGSSTVVACWGKLRELYEVGSRWPLDEDSASRLVRTTGRSARFDGYEHVWGAVEAQARALGLSSAVASPILVNGRLWGTIFSATSEEHPMPADAQSRIAEFSELVATAISNVQAQGEVERLLDEQAALRRVATLVAEGDSPGAVLDAVAAEMERALGADGAMLLRYEPGDEVTVVACIPNERGLPPGTRISHQGHTVSAIVRRSGRPARIGDYSQAQGPLADAARAAEWSNGAVGAPIAVDGGCGA
jgi:GAF domain-containing protein